MWGRDKDGVSTDPVHVDAGGSLDVIEVNVAVLGDHIDHIVLRPDLHNTASTRLVNRTMRYILVVI